MPSETGKPLRPTTAADMVGSPEWLDRARAAADRDQHGAVADHLCDALDEIARLHADLEETARERDIALRRLGRVTGSRPVPPRAERWVLPEVAAAAGGDWLVAYRDGGEVLRAVARHEDGAWRLAGFGVEVPAPFLCSRPLEIAEDLDNG